MTLEHHSAADAAPAEVHDHISALMRQRSIPGLSIAVPKRDRLLFAGGYGQAVIDPANPATPSTSYLWFSMSKLATATAAMRLAEESHLDLDAVRGVPGSATCWVRDRPSAAQPPTANPIPLRWVHPAARLGIVYRGPRHGADQLAVHTVGVCAHESAAWSNHAVSVAPTALSSVSMEARA